MRRYQGDPFWFTAKYNSGKCKCCGKPIKQGDQVFFFPKTRATFCDGSGCGEKEYTMFREACFDEEMYQSRGGDY